MTELGLFIAGTIVSGIVGTGVFLYAMMSFGRWADNKAAESLTSSKNV